MGIKYQKLMADMQAELEEDRPEDKPEEKQDQPEQENQPEKEPERADEPEPEHKPEDGEPAPGPEPEDDGAHAPQPEDKPEQRKREIPDDPLARAEFSFKRQLGKQAKKHEEELAERDAKYEKLAKEFEELKKRIPEPAAEPLKKREDFNDDEDFIQYLLQKGIEKGFAERDAEAAKKAAEAEEQQKALRAQQEELQQKQQAWLENVDQAFEGDKERSQKFLARVQYANKNGLGEILDNCPVAADYLMNDPAGPRVFEKILNDRNMFMAVFNERRLTPMSIFYELKKIEESLVPAQDPEPEQKPAVLPHMGRPGRQAGGTSMTSNDMFSDPRAVKKWLREHRR